VFTALYTSADDVTASPLIAVMTSPGRTPPLKSQDNQLQSLHRHINTTHLYTVSRQKVDCKPLEKFPYPEFANFYLAIQRSVWRDIKFAFFLFVCTVEDISTQDGAIGVKF